MKQQFGKRLLGLAVMVMALMMVTAACDSKPKISDETLMTQVKQAVAAYENIAVQVKDGVVTLSGTIPAESASKTLSEVIAKIPGVKSVDNKLEVKPVQSNNGNNSRGNMQSAGMYMDDAAITAEVKSQLLIKEDIPSMDISVKTTDRVVTLSGSVKSAEQAEMAMQVARQVKDVKDVVNQLQVVE